MNQQHHGQHRGQQTVFMVLCAWCCGVQHVIAWWHVMRSGDVQGSRRPGSPMQGAGRAGGACTQTRWYAVVCMPCQTGAWSVVACAKPPPTSMHQHLSTMRMCTPHTNTLPSGVDDAVEEALRDAAAQQEAALRAPGEERGERRTTRLQGAAEDAVFIRWGGGSVRVRGRRSVKGVLCACMRRVC